MATLRLCYAAGSLREFVESFPVAVNTQRINLTTGAADDVTLPSSIPALSDVVISQTLSVPQGIIKDLAFGACKCGAGEVLSGQWCPGVFGNA